MANLGYIIESAASENIHRQMLEAGLDEIYVENTPVGGVRRPLLKAALKNLKKGDSLHMHSIDQLARDLSDLRHIIEVLNERGVSIRFYKEGLTFDGTDDPVQTLQKRMLAILTDFQQSYIQDLIEEEKQSALVHGRRAGVSTKLRVRDIQDIRSRVSRGANKSALAREYGISRPTLYSILVGI
jgi:DNA invertase Pin-like site-specific DNA recombinase